MPFDPVDPKQRFPDLEAGILQYWQEEDTFKRSIHRRSGLKDDILDAHESGSGENFSFYDGPPFATGLPHYGHLLAGTIKDVIPRYQTMRGKAVERRFGWDCHGLPVENLIEKEHDIKDHHAIEAMGVDKFNDLCRTSVLRYTQEWRQVVERMGRWVDMDWDYRTMDPDYMESIWWVFKQLADKNLIYEGYKSMHVCPRCVTPLSNFEVTQGYKDVTDWTSYTIYPLVDDPTTALIAWTTTTWTLPGNLFLAVGNDISYVKVQRADDDLTYIVAESQVETVFKDMEHEVIGTIKTKELIGQHYEPLFTYFVQDYKEQNAFRVVEANFVTTEDGTGIVHIAPGFGTDDYELGKREGVDVLSHVTMDGHFVDAVTDFAGQEVKPMDDPTKTDKKITEFLKSAGRLFKAVSFKHSYPHCWRCDHPLINYSTSSWFVSVDKIKDKMLSANQATEWVPHHMRDGRFGKWLENARDWAISRNRYWGTPLPIWRTEEGNDLTVIGSRQDLMDHNKIRFTKVTAIRHAESEGNLIPIYQGVPPGTDLTTKGRGQATTAAEWLQDQQVDIIYCSPLARTQQTAQIIAEKTGAKVIVDERLREVEFGDYEGKNVDFNDLTFVKERRKHKLEHNRPESIYHFEGMESWESVYTRVEAFMKEMLPVHRSEHVVVVTHADLMMNVKQFFTGEDPMKLSHQPYPQKAIPHTYYWDHNKQQSMDLHKDSVDDIVWPGSPSDQSVELTLVRHGQTDWNAENRSQGQSDIPLNDTGKQQAREQAAKLKGQQFDVVISSDLSRASETAQIIADELGLEVHELWPELQERDTGDWNGKVLEDVFAEHPCSHPEVQSSTFHHETPPNGESLSDFYNRCRSCLIKICEQYAGKKVLLVSHSGTMRMLRTYIENHNYVGAANFLPQNGEALTLTVHQPCKRIPEVLDCWFESGSMPYAQQHFPFEMHHSSIPTPSSSGGGELPHSNGGGAGGGGLPPDFPADFIAEGVDQTRGWFYTLTVLGAALFDRSPFEHCIVNGIVLAEDGKKMSKRLKNYPDPMDVVERQGADAIRFTLMSSPAVRAEDLRFSEKLVEDTVRNVMLPLWNTYALFTTYANACDFTPVDNRKESTHPLDQWIKAEVQDLTNRMTKDLDDYDLSATCNELHETIDALTNWYVRLSRRRFAGKGVLDAYPEASGSANEADRAAALNTLYDVLLSMSQLLAPFCPFITEAIYLNLVPEEHGSVHFTDWPEVRELSADEQSLIEKNRLLRLVVSLSNSVRAQTKVKNRQPLATATVALPPALSGITLTDDDLALLRQELNVKVVDFTDDPAVLAESYAQVDARKVGPRLGKRVQEVIQAGKNGDFTVEADGTIRIGEEVLTTDEVQIVYRGKEGQDVAADKGVVVSVDTAITDALQLEGDARDIIRGVQRLRKEAGLAFTDTIALQVTGADDVLKEHAVLIAAETKSELTDVSGDDQTIEVGNRKVVVRFEKL